MRFGWKKKYGIPASFLGVSFAAIALVASYDGETDSAFKTSSDSTAPTADGNPDPLNVDAVTKDGQTTTTDRDVSEEATDSSSKDVDSKTPSSEPSHQQDSVKSTGHGYTPARFDPASRPIRTSFPDPAGTSGSYVTQSEVVPQVKIRLSQGIFKHADRPSSITTSNQVAGSAFTDPLVFPGVTGGPIHEHEYLGNRLGPDANILDLANEPFNFEPGSNAAVDGWGYRGLIEDNNGKRFGYAPGVWWPTIRFDGKPVEMKRGIATYYVRQRSHDGHRLYLLPNGVGYVTNHQVKLQKGPKDWRIRVFGPTWFHKDIHVGPFPRTDPGYNNKYLSYDSEIPDNSGNWFATPQFQTYLKFDIPAGAPSYEQMMKAGGHQSPRFVYGADPNVAFHLDYVSGWTDMDFAQEILDRAVNRDVNNIQNNVKFEGLRFDWE